MSHKALNYTKAIKLFRQKAKSIISTLPNGMKLIADRMLLSFLEQEKEILSKWYCGMLFKLLEEEDFSRLLASKKKGLHFLQLIKVGLSKEKIKNLREELFILLKDTFTSSSGVGLNAKMTYKVRLYAQEH